MVSVISPIGTLTNTLPVKKSCRVNIIPIGDKIMPGEIIVTQTKINAVPGGSTTNSYRDTNIHKTIEKITV
jgi:hypothetical protein